MRIVSWMAVSTHIGFLIGLGRKWKVERVWRRAVEVSAGADAIGIASQNYLK